MRAILVATLLATTASAENPPSGGVAAVYWEPPTHPALAAAARAAFVEAVRPLKPRLVDGGARPPAIPSLLPRLEEAKAAFGRFEFSRVIELLDQLQRLADGSGGGDLDARQLSEIFFYRGVCRVETGARDVAWEDFVRAARLDPSRVIDAARFPPPAVEAYRRAVHESAELPRARLQIAAPAGAALRVDGTPIDGAITVTIGQHYVAVAADGFEPWSSVVSLTGDEVFTPPLRAYAPPDGDHLLALAGTGARRLILGALVPAPNGWQFTARDVTLSDGRYLTDSVVLGEQPTSVAVTALMRRLLPPPSKPNRWLWWVVGGSLAAAAVTIGLGVGLGTSPPTVSGKLQLR